MLYLSRLAVVTAKSVSPQLVTSILHYIVGLPALSIFGCCSLEPADQLCYSDEQDYHKLSVQ